MSQGNPKQVKAQVYALSIHSALRKYGALDLATLLDRTALASMGQITSGMHYSRRHLDPAAMANEIICNVRDANGTWFYFLADSDQQASDYEWRRRMIALGHVQSVIRLEEKREEKWPNPQRAAAIKMLQMSYQLLLTAP